MTHDEAEPDQNQGERPTAVSLRDAVIVWCRVAAMSFGGPAGQIAVMHRILVEEKRWVGERQFLHALNYCMLLPGPEAQQLATYIGWLLHRTLGGLIAGLLFILPGFVSILLLSILYAEYRDLSYVEGVFDGLKPAVVAIVIAALARIGSRALRTRTLTAIALLSFAGIFFGDVPFPLIVVCAGLAGAVIGRFRPTWLQPRKDETPRATSDDSGPTDQVNEVPVRLSGRNHSLLRSAVILVLGLIVWLGPIGVLRSRFGPEDVYYKEAAFFSHAAVFTFGGAYAVLAYVGQECVETYAWLQPNEMLDGLGMAETTPGPLVQVVQFVGFMGAYRNPGELDPVTAGIFGSLVTTWATFAPCFLWIFLGAPWIERLREQQALNSGLTAITAAVVGVILNLSIWFSIHTLFAEVTTLQGFGMRMLMPQWDSLNVSAAVIAVAAFLAMFRFKAGMLVTLFGCAVAGVCLKVLT